MKNLLNFQRLNTNDGNFPGSGMGLALCRKIVTNHKGIIFAESKSEDGACFFVILPIDQPSKENASKLPAVAGAGL